MHYEMLFGADIFMDLSVLHNTVSWVIINGVIGYTR